MSHPDQWVRLGSALLVGGVLLLAGLPAAAQPMDTSSASPEGPQDAPSDSSPRTYTGTEVLLRLNYSQDLTSDRFRYGRYVAEVRQYLPLGLFPNSRRLVLRGRLEQTEPLFEEEAIPFYQLPSLGGQNMLRRFTSNRFQGEKSLVLNTEYRYPVWSNWDAGVFVDSGQVFPGLGDVAADRFQWSYRGGLHMLNQKG